MDSAKVGKEKGYSNDLVVFYPYLVSTYKTQNKFTKHCLLLLQRPIINTNDYQNLSHLQAAMFGDTPPESPQQKGFPHHSGTELVRRDSGNWSGERNSTSSSSSTSLENPYHYIVGKMHFK